MLLECRNCGAPLDVKSGARFVKCNYCDFTSQLDQLRTIQQQTPPAWKAPAVWTPPAHLPAPSIQLKFHRPNFAPFIALATFIPLLGAGIAAFAITRSVPKATFTPFTTSPAAAAEERAAEWDGKSTLECPMNGKIRVEGKSAKVDGVAIRLGLNCEATLVGSTISGRTAVELGSNAKLFVEGGSLEGDDVAVELGTNGKIELRKQAKVKSPRTAFQMGVNARVTMEDGEVDARDAFRFGINPHVRLVRSKVVAKDSAMTGGTNPEVELDNSSVTAQAGIVTGTNSKITIRENSSVDAQETAIGVKGGVCTVSVEGSRIKGDPALEADRNANVRLRNARIEGKRKLAKGLKVDER
jgi:LSD1 subclass zinc finger protein